MSETADPNNTMGVLLKALKVDGVANYQTSGMSVKTQCYMDASFWKDN